LSAGRCVAAAVDAAAAAAVDAALAPHPQWHSLKEYPTTTTASSLRGSSQQ
jgi:hypothetical protein